MLGPQEALRALAGDLLDEIGGRLIAVVGEAPVMEMQLVTRTEEDAFNTVVVLETLVASLENTARRDKFVF